MSGTATTVAAGQTDGSKESSEQGDTESITVTEVRVEATGATIGELKAALPGVPAAFLVECLEKTMTMDQAKDAAMELMRAENAAAKQKIEKLEAAADKPGVEAVGTGASGDAGSTGGGDAASRWNAAVDEKVKAGKTRADAVRAVVHEDPELNAQYVAEHNAAHGRAGRTV